MKIIKKSSGFTLIEIMIAVAIMGILVAGIYGLFTSMYNNYVSQNQLADVEQNARIGIEQMIREIRLAGYKTPTGTLVTYKTTAAEFVFQENVQPVLGPGVGVNKKIEYYWDQTNNVLRRGEEPENNSGAGTYTSDSTSVAQTPLFVSGYLQPLSIPVTNLAFTYYDANNTQLTPNATSNFTTITRMRVTLTTQGKNPSPDKIGINVGGVYYKTVTVDADIRLRNMGIGQANSATPPAPPINLQSRDTGNPCGSLTVSWAANTEADLAGYVIYYKPSGSAVPYYVVNVGNSTSFVIQNLVIGTTYDINAKAYNTSGLYSGYSLSPAGLVAANSNVGTTAQDTQPNTTPPAAPVITAASAGDKVATLTWTPSTTGNIPGYNIYRSAYSGSGYGAYALVNQSGPVAGTTYTDNFAGIPAPNCPLSYVNKQPYQYKMTAVTCGGSGAPGPFSGVILGDGSAGYSGTAFNTYPKDSSSTYPYDPISFTGRPGANQAILSWTTPLAPPAYDAFGVTVFRLPGTIPPVWNQGTLVYQDNIYVGPSTFEQYVDNGATNGSTFSYTAFTIDNCGIHSAGSFSTQTVTPCGDGTYPNAPDRPTGLTGSSCGLNTLTWSWPTRNGPNGTPPYQIFNLTSDPKGDVTGFIIYRCTSLPCSKVSINPTMVKLNAIPWTNNSFVDNTAQPGIIYYYFVTAVDCANNESAESSTFTVNNYIQLSSGGLTQDVYFTKGTSTYSGVNPTTSWSAATTLTDTNNNFSVWPAYQYGTLNITGGTDSGELRPIVGNSLTSITIPTNYTWPSFWNSTSWAYTVPDTTSLYEIDRPVTANSSNLSVYPYSHDDVKFFVKNTNGNTISIRSGATPDTATITWTNLSGAAGKGRSGTTALLYTIKINGTTIWSVAPAFGVTSGTRVTFTTGVTLPGFPTANGTPMELIFADISGQPINMKGETINMTMSYGTLNGDGITYNTCVWDTTSSPSLAIQVGKGVSIGPIDQIPTGLYNSLNSPYYITTTVPGSNILYPGMNNPVWWPNPYPSFTYIFNWNSMTDSTGNMISSASTYYCKQFWGGSATWGSNVTNTAPLPADPCYQANGSPLTSGLSTWNNTGSIWQGIPESGDPYRVWYYVQVTDNQGNVSLSPSYNVNNFTAYTYDEYGVFTVSYAMSWSNNGSGPGTKSVGVATTVSDVAGTGNALGSPATLSITFTGSPSGTTETLSWPLTTSVQTYSSDRLFTSTDNVMATVTVKKQPGFNTKTCTTATLVAGGSVATTTCP